MVEIIIFLVLIIILLFGICYLLMKEVSRADGEVYEAQVKADRLLRDCVVAETKAHIATEALKKFSNC